MNEFFTPENLEILAVLIPLILSIIGNGVLGIKGLISKVMLYAEKKASAELESRGAATGEEKKEYVIAKVYDRFPTWLQKFISKNYIAKKVENIIDDLDDLKDDGVLNESNHKED